MFIATPPFLIPALLEETNLNLTQAGLLAALPSLGMVLMLVIWGRWQTASANASC